MYSFIVCRFVLFYCVYTFLLVCVTRVFHCKRHSCVSLLERFTTVKTFTCNNFDST
jgi:hypothetical protein